MFRIGVDVGGTNTDSVLLDVRPEHISNTKTRGVIAFHKHPTTNNVTYGIELVVKKVLEEAAKIVGRETIKKGILSLTIGTTHFINAVVQSDTSRLAKVAVLRLAAPYTHECPPFIDFPPQLEKIMNGYAAIISGGLQIDGRTINPIVELELVEQAKQIKARSLKDVVVAGVFSPLDVLGSQEYAARDILKRELGEDVNIVCSRDVAQIGLLERENASILNASISTFAQHTIKGFQDAMQRLGLTCPLYITQNDGTLTTAASAARLPIRTFSSGATNSMRGASFLAGVGLGEGKGKAMLVADVGGTSTDVGVLLPSGFPRQAAAFIEVGGVRTNFAMPDVNSIGLGGGSRVRVFSDKITVGPDSVGHHLTREALTFGGSTLTATDIIVRSGTVPGFGDPEKVQDIDMDVVTKSKSAMKRMLENVVDRMKTSPDDCTLLLVGGGSILAPENIKGVGEIITPPFHSVANAVGAAIANVSGEVDTIEVLQGKSLPDVLERMKAEAKVKCVEAGAKAETVQVVEVQVLPVQYVTNQATRLIVRAVGELGVPETVHVDLNVDEKGSANEAEQQVESDTEEISGPSNTPSKEEERIDYETYKPRIESDVWHLSETDLFFIMEGCGILGTGGGGSPYPTYLMCREILRQGGSIRIVDHTSLPDDAKIARGCGMGSPSVGSERILGGRPVVEAGKELAKYLGVQEYTATICDEIGGANGMMPLITSFYYNVPVLDGDLMGRAYPLLNQVLPAVYDRPNALAPCGLCDGDGNVVLLTKAKNEFLVETLMRTITTEMGSSAALVCPPLALRDARDYGVIRTQSQAWWLGRAVAICRQKNNLKSIPDEIMKLQTGCCLFVGKIVNVSREVRAGFTFGEVTIANLKDDELEDSSNHSFVTGDVDEHLVIPFQNENLAAYLVKADGSRKMAAVVPDLIAVLDSQSGSHLGTQMCKC
ncbi:hypothetical protein E1B28_013239 [Marasmius oreades]|uniref:Hydantoinase n=1 Tax=Marasmius oreades TaxID=181124 RepID=A0A9P7UPP6_9AGAR|nr:uncharacterized protein E1B28_013239 [Marasmius oreades]KAG7087259.1 hypothetical protein E1B28_013239 [Marasmius oreades]